MIPFKIYFLSTYFPPSSFHTIINLLIKIFLLLRIFSILPFTLNTLFLYIPKFIKRDWLVSGTSGNLSIWLYFFVLITPLSSVISIISSPGELGTGSCIKPMISRTEERGLVKSCINSGTSKKVSVEIFVLKTTFPSPK